MALTSSYCTVTEVDEAPQRSPVRIHQRLDDPFQKSRYGIEDAKRRIGEFELGSIAFAESHPYAIVTEPSADGTQEVHKVKLTQPLPPTLCRIAVDAVSDLRGALDRAAYACTIASMGDRDTSRVRSFFPFGDIAKQPPSDRSARGSSADIPNEIFDLMASFTPYEGGDDLLYALNQLCNTQEDKIVVPVCTQAGPTTFRNFKMLQNPGTVVMHTPEWDATKNEMVLITAATGTEYSYDKLQIAVYVATAHATVVGGQPAVDVLDALLGRVESILVAVEAEAHRIGLFG